MKWRDAWWYVFVVLPLLGVAIGLVIWRGPNWRLVSDAFTVVSWEWVLVAIGLNLLSVVTRSLSWNTAIRESMEPPYPRYRLVFSAFCVGLFANAVLPGRVGELARVAVLTRRMGGRSGTAARLVGSVFAHRMFDLFPVTLLVVWVLLEANIPQWAYLSIEVALGVGVLLFVLTVLIARRQSTVREGVGRLRLLWARVRQGLAVMRRPAAAATATAYQTAGWGCQLLAVWSAMYAFHIHQPLVAAGIVLLLMNVATIFPLWPGNVGLTQAAIALPLVNYGVDYARGIAFGIGLQLIEASVGIGIGLVFLAREGLSYATLKRMEQEEEAEFDAVSEQALADEEAASAERRARAKAS